MLLFSRKVMSDSLQAHGLQHARLPVLYYLLEFAQTHVHCVNDAIHPSHPLSPSSLALNLSQHQGANSIFFFFFCWSIFFADHCRSSCNSGLKKPWPTQRGVLKHILANRAISCWTKMGSIFTSAWISHWMWTILRGVWPEVDNWGEPFRSWELKSLQMALLDVGKQCTL